MYPSKGHKVDHEERHPELWEISEQEREYLLKRLAMSGAERTRAYLMNNWIEEKDFKGWRWERYNVQRRIVSAANRYKDVVLCAPRHSCPLMVMTMAFHGGMNILHEYAGKDHAQGFVDQFGTWYTREEAYILARTNGQIRHPESCQADRLFSEGIY